MPVAEPDVLVVHVDVHEPVQVARVVEQVRADAREAVGQIVEHLTDGRARGVDLTRSADRLAEDGGHADG